VNPSDEQKRERNARAEGFLEAIEFLRDMLLNAGPDEKKTLPLPRIAIERIEAVLVAEGVRRGYGT
jgi:hypothetical protein